VNVSLRFLKKFSRLPIVVLKSRTDVSIEHDQVLDIPIDPALDNHQASIVLKTGLHKIFGDHQVVRCYLDSDVIAVKRTVDSVFDQMLGQIAFCEDHVDISGFSKYAVNCGCRSRLCDHLVQAVKETFGVTIARPDWRHWNGGVFVFGEASIPLLDRWHEFTLRILNNPYWTTRDQGTLAAAAWDQSLQDAPVLPRAFNTIVDCFARGIPEELRPSIPVEGLAVGHSHSLEGDSQATPSFLHFINGGVMRRGWKEWDRVEELLVADDASPIGGSERAGLDPRPSQGVPGRDGSRALSQDNRIVHGLWIGDRLSRLELLTIHSFLRHGHEYHLWLYDELQNPLPAQVVIEDANEIIPRDRVIRRKDTDPEAGVGRGSYGLFSDLFRYKLLYERGGYWADMDVTCLRPFDFPDEYVFRTHRVGVVGNIMKCPRRSPLMKETYELVAREADANSPWLMSNRVLSRNVERSGLSRFIREDFCNADSWMEQVRPLLEGDPGLPPAWHAIHWMNEVWRTLEATGGMYRGRLIDRVPDKDDPKPGTTLFRLYDEHGLSGAAAAVAPYAGGRPSHNGSGGRTAGPRASTIPPPPLRTATRQPISPNYPVNNHINILVPSLTRGGAERIVVETLRGLEGSSTTARLFVIHEARVAYHCPDTPLVGVFRLHELPWTARLQTIALEILASPNPVLFTHMIEARDLRVLWDYGVRTIPVVHNSQPSWQDSPESFDHPNVPLVVSVSDSVAEQLRDRRCPRRVVTIRHELQRWFSVDELQDHRTSIRDQYGIPEDTLLIGMVGEFKSQKAYTRAIRVLAAVREHHPAKLMILGGWDHEWGNGRAAYTAACRQAIDLDVMADLLTPGRVRDVEPYYAAFDVFLNTSVYEGLSIATLEAIQSGCPVVTADAGGNAEALPPEAVIVKDSADIAAYVSGIESALDRETRLVPQRPDDAGLIPRLWTLLGRYSLPEAYGGREGRDAILFLTDNLNVGGAPQSLVNMLCELADTARPWLGVMTRSNHQSHVDALTAAGVRVFSTLSAPTYLERLEQCLRMIGNLGTRTIVFWNLDARIKLLLAKILPRECIQLVDVSPGPLLFDELDERADFQRRIAFDRAQYFDRVDRFVSKYAGGGPGDDLLAPEKLVVIPNGVPDPDGTLTPETAPFLPPGADPELIVGTCCRIVPDKRIEFLVAMMAELNLHLPGAYLVVVGGVHPSHARYWDAIQTYINNRGVSNILFVGHQENVASYLRQFRVFVMISDRQGCPNASLEAMAMGLPIVANPDGGTAEQVEDRVNGFLVSDQDPAEMAETVRFLLTNPEIRLAFGEASLRLAREKYSMEKMGRRYLDLLRSLRGEACSARS